MIVLGNFLGNNTILNLLSLLVLLLILFSSIKLCYRCEAKENEISFQRKFLNDSQRVLHEEEERLLEKQALLNQREECIFDREKELIYLEKRLEDDKSTIVGEFKALKEEKATLDLKIAALTAREDVCLKYVFCSNLILVASTEHIKCIYFFVHMYLVIIACRLLFGGNLCLIKGSVNCLFYKKPLRAKSM